MSALGCDNLVSNVEATGTWDKPAFKSNKRPPRAVAAGGTRYKRAKRRLSSLDRFDRYRPTVLSRLAKRLSRPPLGSEGNQVRRLASVRLSSGERVSSI